MRGDVYHKSRELSIVHLHVRDCLSVRRHSRCSPQSSTYLFLCAVMFRDDTDAAVRLVRRPTEIAALTSTYFVDAPLVNSN